MCSRLTLTIALLLAVAVVSGGCSNKEPASPGGGYDPVIPAAFAPAVTNPFFKLTPGTTLEYRGNTGGGVETNTVTVRSETRVIQGVTATEVLDQVYLNGSLIEETSDWYAQDPAGNVWYLGEDSKEIRNGMVVGTEGSWEWGIDGALPGIIMWADPAAHVGEDYRQEFYEGEAEDWGKVLAVNQSVVVPYGTLSGCVQTEDWSGLESGGREHKFYSPQIGNVLSVGLGSGERLELIRVTGPR